MTDDEIEKARDALSALSSRLGQGLGGTSESIPGLVARIVGGIDEHIRVQANILHSAERGCGDCPQGPGGGLRATYHIDCGECRRFYADLRVPK